MPRVNVPGVGQVNFPDDMPASEIQRVIETELVAQPEAQGSRDPSTLPDMSPTLGDQYRSAWRPVIKGAGQTAEAIVEGPMRLLEGAGELASAGAQAPFDLYDKVRSPELSELVTGKRPSSTLLKDYQSAVEGRRAQQRAAFEEVYGKDSYPEMLSKGSEIGFSMLTGAGEVKAVKTLWGAIKAGTKVGAVSGASTYSGATEVWDKVQDTLVGGALGGIFGTVPGLWTAGKNAIRNYLTADPVPAAQQAAAKVGEAFPSLAGEMTIGQTSGNVRTLGTESKVAARKAQEQWLRQQSKLVTELDALAKKYGPDLPPEEVAARGQQAIANASKKLTMTRKAIWNADLDAIRTKIAADVQAGTSDGLVQMPGLGDRVKQILGDFSVGTEALSPRIRKILETHEASGGALLFDDVAYLLRAMNEKNFSVIQGTGNARAEAVAAKKLRGAVTESLDETAESSEIGALLAEARQTYARQSAGIKEINTSAAARALGVDKNGYSQLIQNPERAVDRLLELTPSQQRQAVGILKMHDPELVASLRGANLRNAMEDATEVTAAGTPNFNVQKFLKETVGDGGLRGSGFYTEAEGKVLEENLKALNVLLNRAGYRAPTTGVEEAGMTAAGLAAGAGSVPFATRIVGRLMGGFGMEKVLFDPAARKEFLTIANTWGAKSGAGSAAAGRIGAMLDGELTDEE